MRRSALRALVLTMAVVGLSSAPAHAQATQPTQPAQRIRVVNDASVPTWLVKRMEVAALMENIVLRSQWPNAPAIRFVTKGPAWTITLVPPDQWTDADPTVGGIHKYSPQTGPYAMVDWNRAWTRWSHEFDFSHELTEMLVNPGLDRYINGQKVEVCDPVEGNSTAPSPTATVDGAVVVDFVYPSWYTSGGGPWDWLHRTRRALDTSHGDPIPTPTS